MRAWGLGFGTFLVTGFLTLGAVAATCGRPATANAGPDAARERALRGAATMAEERLANVRLAMTSGADTSMRCAALLDEGTRSEDAERLCGFEAPLAWAQIHARKLEQTPSPNAASCVHLRGALDALAAHGHGTHPEVATLSAQYAKRCGG